MRGCDGIRACEMPPEVCESRTCRTRAWSPRMSPAAAIVRSPNDGDGVADAVRAALAVGEADGAATDGGAVQLSARAQVRSSRSVLPVCSAGLACLGRASLLARSA